MLTRERRLEATRFATAGRRVGVVLDDLPPPARIEQAIEAAEERAALAGVGRLLAGELDGWPGPGQRRPPVRIVQDVLHGHVEQASEVHRNATQLVHL